jgi:hypothetical protein
VSQIPHEVRGLAADLKRQATLLSTLVRAVRSEAPEADVSRVLVELAGMHADLNKLQSLLAAAEMVGVMQPKPTLQAHKLELHPGHADHDAREREAMLRSLHRCGDHTLDPVPEDPQDCHVAVYNQAGGDR